MRSVPSNARKQIHYRIDARGQGPRSSSPLSLPDDRLPTPPKGAAVTPSLQRPRGGQPAYLNSYHYTISVISER